MVTTMSLVYFVFWDTVYTQQHISRWVTKINVHVMFLPDIDY